MRLADLLLCSGGKTLHSETYTSNTTWTAPAGVTNLTSVTGKGSSGTSDSGSSSLQTIGTYTLIYVSGTGGSVGSMDWSNIYSAAVANLPGPTATNVSIPSGNWLILQDNTISSISTAGPYAYTIVAGSAYLESVNGALTSGPLTWAWPAPNPAWQIKALVGNYIAGHAGAAATAFGQTFPGGTYVGGVGSPAAPTTFTNIAVTPGTGYPLVIPAGGSITINYLA